jgi:hypothetical protein
MDALVSPRTSDEGRLLRVVRVRFGDCASSDKSLEKIAFNGLLVVRPAVLLESSDIVNLELQAKRY